MTDVAPCGCLAAKFDSCNSLLSSFHALLVNILRCVRLYIKRKHYNIIIFYASDDSDWQGLQKHKTRQTAWPKADQDYFVEQFGDLFDPLLSMKLSLA